MPNKARYAKSGFFVARKSNRLDMKKFLSIVGGIFLLIAFTAAGFIGYGAYMGNRLDASSRAYVEANVPAIVSTWSKDELQKRAAPQLQEIINAHPAEIERLFQKLSRLGTLESLQDVKGESNVSYTADHGKVITASYMATGKFEHGEAKIAMRLVQTSGQWQFLLLNITSPLFLQ